jgi:hypothetical protein
MDDEIKGWRIGSTYMTWVAGFGLALVLVGLGLLAAASIGLWPARGEGGLELGGILNFAESSTAEKKENNGSPPIPKTRSLPPPTQIARASGDAGGRGGRDKKKTNSKASKASRPSPAPTTTPPPPPVAAPHQHGPPSEPPGKSRGRGKKRGIEHGRGPSGLGPPGLLKK